MTQPTRDELHERNARLARRLGQLALREHIRVHGRSSLAACPDPDCKRTWLLLERNAPDEPGRSS